MGWLGWEPKVVMATDVNIVIMALKSKSDLLSTIYGSGKKTKPTRKGPVTANAFKSWSQQHNRLLGSSNE